MPSGLIFALAAGGTGGHMVPAHALAAELRSRGHEVLLVTDERGTRIPGLFDGASTHVLAAGRLGGGIAGMLRAARSVIAGRSEARALFRRQRPAAVVGFGGYPAFPALLAASAARIPTVIHEQNAVLGRVNRLLAGEAHAIATAYPHVERLGRRHLAKVELVGNPVRSAIAALGEQPYPAFDGGARLHLLITGGSQGASILGEVVPEAAALLEPGLRSRLALVQQCRAEDLERVRARYAAIGVEAELATYLDDMPARLGRAHLMIGRAGASTIAELTAAGRPAILVPLPSATNDHQTANARELERVGGARMIVQSEFTPIALARAIEALVADPQALAEAAGRSLAAGRPRAASDLADLVERVAGPAAPMAVGRARSGRSRPFTLSAPGVPA